MEPLIPKKREVVAYVPYRKRTDGSFEFFLQKRDAAAPVHANMFSLFGGGLEEGESLTDALVRETEEEMVRRPEHPEYFCVFESDRGRFNTFIERVGEDFDSIVDVREGEYGRFLTLPALEREHAANNASDIVLMAVRGLDTFLRK